jgi:hypothetical protein
MKITKTAIIILVSIVTTLTKAKKNMIDNCVWTAKPHVQSYTDRLIAEWKAVYFNCAQHGDGIHIGDANTNFHLVVASSNVDPNRIMIYTQSKAQQVYWLEDKNTKHFYHGSVRPNNSDHVEAQFLKVSHKITCKNLDV